MLAASTPSMAGLEGFGPSLSHPPAPKDLPGGRGYSFRGMSTALGHPGHHLALPKLDTSGINIDVSGSLRTAPPYGGPRGYGDMETRWFGPESTVNPAQLHFSHSPQSFAYETPASPSDQSFAAIPSAHAALDDDGHFVWPTVFDNPLSSHQVHEQAVDEASPSIISTGSHSGLSEPMLDGLNASVHPIPMVQNAAIPSNYPVDWPLPAYHDPFVSGQLSPKSLQTSMGAADQYFPSPLLMNVPTPRSMIPGPCYPYFHPPMIIEPDVPTPGNSADSISSSNRQSSVTSLSADSLTDAALQAFLTSTSLPPTRASRHLAITQTPMTSPMYPTAAESLGSVTNAPLPRAHDVQCYVAAYIEHFHPHLPFLHVPSLSWSGLSYGNDLSASNDHLYTAEALSSGGEASLILAAAAIGALYKHEVHASKCLFEMAKQATQVSLEGSRAGQVSGRQPGSTMAPPHQDPPLWLIQAMALIVIYGHQCDETIPSEIASSQCATLVGFARGLHHASLPSDNLPVKYDQLSPMCQLAAGHETRPGAHGTGPGHSSSYDEYETLDWQREWRTWRMKEERKRTFYLVFVISSLLISGRFHGPTLTNAEIRLDLPCHEDLWAADSAESWRDLGGRVAAEREDISFAAALSYLLTANQRPPEQQHYHPTRSDDQAMTGWKADDVPPSRLKASAFGCLILIHALHSYIWETRQRHAGRPWTAQETEQMNARVEPALNAWQAMWSVDPLHGMERPNPSGRGSLSDDCIPLLDMAYLGLYVNLGCAKEAFWRRDYNAVAHELAYGPDLVPVPSSDVSGEDGLADGETLPKCGNDVANPYKTSNRERCLRQAGYYAANSLTMSSKLGLTSLHVHSRDLPLQSAVSVYDAAQILAEWVATVQGRVGHNLGVLGIDYVDWSRVPRELLDEEDCQLLEKVKGLVEELEGTVVNCEGFGPHGQTNHLPGMEEYGFGSKLLAITAYMLKVAPVWPGQSFIPNPLMIVTPDMKTVQLEMALALETQAAHIFRRTRDSLVAK